MFMQAIPAVVTAAEVSQSGWLCRISRIGVKIKTSLHEFNLKVQHFKPEGIRATVRGLCRNLTDTSPSANET